MKRVARRVTLSLAEAKRFSVIQQGVFSNTNATQVRWMYRNLFSSLPAPNINNASTSYVVVGNEIVDPMLKFKATFAIPYANILASEAALVYGTICCYVYLIAANDFTGAVGNGAPPPGSIAFTPYPGQYSEADMGWFLNQDPYKPTLNGNNVKVLKKWSKRHHPETHLERVPTGTVTTDARGIVAINIEGSYRWKRKLTFEDNPFGDSDANFPRAGTLRGWNYYLMLGWGAPSVITLSNSQPQCNMDTFLYFKDP